MKKILYFIPAIVACLIYGSAFIITGIEPLAYVFCGLLLLAGVMLSRKMWWGCIFGIIMGSWLMLLDLQETGQLIKQWPIGLIFLVYFIACGYIVKRKNG